MDLGLSLKRRNRGEDKGKEQSAEKERGVLIPGRNRSEPAPP
jgi:hypothetical protein